MNIKVKTAEILNRGERNATGGIACEGLALLGLRVPATFQGGEIGIQASIDNTDWGEVFAASGQALLADIPARPGRLVAFLPELTAPWPYLRVVCSHPQQPGVTFTLRFREN